MSRRSGKGPSRIERDRAGSVAAWRRSPHLEGVRPFLLRSVEYGEADRIVTFLTLEFGKVGMFAKGARRSRRRFGGALEPFLGIFIGFWWIFCMLDAHRRATLYNLALEGGRAPDLPRDLELPGMGGGMASGVTLVVIGVLLLLHTRFEMDLEWVEEWWPLALVLFGGWLIHKARRQKAA